MWDYLKGYQEDTIRCNLKKSAGSELRALSGIPRIEDLNAEPGKIPYVSRRQREAVFQRGCPDEAINCRQRGAATLHARREYRPAIRNSLRDREKPGFKGTP